MRIFFGITILVLVHGGFALEFEENDGDLHEGDIVLNFLQKAALGRHGDPTASVSIARGITAKPSLLWSRLVVPFTVSSELQQIPAAMTAINAAIVEWEQRSCLRFVHRTTETDYIEIFKGSGCWSYVGRQGGKQQLSLASGCWHLGTVAHEFGHALGFWHEQSRPDRDNFVTIVWENIPEKKRHNFRKYNRTQIDSLGVDYDYLGIMHYSATAFSYNGQPTIISNDTAQIQLGQRVGLSPSDVKQADLLYKCNGKTTRPTPTTASFLLPGTDACDFDTMGDLCGFYNTADSDDFDWIQRLGKTPSSGTGPVADHTTDRWGWFMYIETSSPRFQGEKAILRSKAYPSSTKDRCLHFYYHMMGKNIGQLNVTCSFRSGTSDQSWNLLSLSGNKGDKWLRADVQIPQDALINGYTISFVGVRGDGYQGDVAIDDVYFTEDKC